MVTTESQVVYDDDGAWKPRPLDVALQASPIYGFLADDFNSDGYKDVLAVGNFYGNTPSIGKEGASFGNSLLGTAGGRDFSCIEPVRIGFSVKGEARDIQILNAGPKKWVLVSENNGGIVIHKVLSR